MDENLNVLFQENLCNFTFAFVLLVRGEKENEIFLRNVEVLSSRLD